MFLEPFSLPKFFIEFGQDLGHRQPQSAGIAPHKTSNVNRRGENFVTPFLKGLKMIRSNLGLIGQIANRATALLPRFPQLITNSSHGTRGLWQIVLPADNAQITWMWLSLDHVKGSSRSYRHATSDL